MPSLTGIFTKIRV